MATLTANISASATQVAVSGSTAAAQPGQQYRIDDEIVTLHEFVRTKAERRGPRNRNVWRITRGEMNTTAATHSAGATIFAVAPAVATSESLSEPEPYASAGESGGGVAVLEDPGEVHPGPGVAVTAGHRVSATIDGELRVWEVTVGGTTVSTAGFADDGSGLSINLAPLGLTNEGAIRWAYLGIVGQLSWEVTPGLPPEIVVDGEAHSVSVVNPSGPGDSVRAFVIDATVDDARVHVFDVKTDGDADWFLDQNAGAGFRFNQAIDGVPAINAGITQMTTTGFSVDAAGEGIEGFAITYDPFMVIIFGLPSVDPEVAGQLYTDGALAAGTPRALMVSGGPA